MIIDIPDEERRIIAEGINDEELGFIGPQNSAERVVFLAGRFDPRYDSLSVSRDKKFVKRLPVPPYGSIYTLTTLGQKYAEAIVGDKPR